MGHEDSLVMGFWELARNVARSMLGGRSINGNGPDDMASLTVLKVLDRDRNGGVFWGLADERQRRAYVIRAVRTAIVDELRRSKKVVSFEGEDVETFEPFREPLTPETELLEHEAAAEEMKRWAMSREALRTSVARLKGQERRFAECWFEMLAAVPGQMPSNVVIARKSGVSNATGTRALARLFGLVRSELDV